LTGRCGLAASDRVLGDARKVNNEHDKPSRTARFGSLRWKALRFVRCSTL